MSEFEKLWDTVGTMSRSKASIWVPLVQLERASMRICLGHYASPSFDSPNKAKRPSSAGKEALLELTDTHQSLWRLQPATSWLSSVVDRFLPPPVRLTQSWCKRFKGQRQRLHLAFDLNLAQVTTS